MPINLSDQILLQIQSKPKRLSSSSIKIEGSDREKIFKEVFRLHKSGLIYAEVEKAENDEIVYFGDIELSPSGIRYLVSLQNKS